jgi:hypothetical protein
MNKNLEKNERLWARDDESIRFMFLDDPQIGLLEHRLGRVDTLDFVNCLGKVNWIGDSNGSCPICNAGFKSYFIMLHSVFVWQKNEQSYSFSKKIFAAHADLYPSLCSFRKDFGGSLKGGIFTLTKERMKDEVISPVLRDDSIIKLSDDDILDMVIDDGYEAEMAQPYDYEVLFANDSVEVLKANVLNVCALNSLPGYYGRRPKKYLDIPDNHFED